MAAIGLKVIGTGDGPFRLEFVLMMPAGI